MSDLTVGAVIQVNLSRFVFLYSNTATQKAYLYQNKEYLYKQWMAPLPNIDTEILQWRQQM